MNNGDFDDEDPTRPGIHPPSPGASHLANLCAIFSAISVECGEAARIYDALPPDKQRIFRRDVAGQLREAAGLVTTVSFDLENDPL